MEPPTPRHHRDLILWQKAMKLAVLTHRCTGGFPKCEMFGLTSQVRRSAVSVPSNIAEGASRRTTREFIHFLHIARGSLAELETRLQLAREFQYLGGVDFATLSALGDEVGRLLTAFLAALRRRSESRE
jgi:four helix bundle protein